MTCNCRSKKCLYITLAVGILCCAAGGALLWGFAIFTKNTVISDTTLVPGTTAYETWVLPPVPLLMQYWVWDIKNPDEFLNGDKAILEQRGPYTYLEYREKINITHYHGNGTVRFRNSKMYVFDLDQSVGPDTETFHTANIPVFTVANLLRYSPGPVKNIQKMIHALSGATSVIEISVADILWGYEDDYLILFDQLFPGLLPTTEFGIFQGSNNSAEYIWEEYTGETGHENTGQVISWDGMELLPWWVTDYANMINGSDGTVTPPFVETTDQIYFYVPDICRQEEATVIWSKNDFLRILRKSGFLTYEYAYKLRGIPVGRFTAPPYLYADAEEYPDNAGFCTPDGTHCPPTGLLNASACQSGAPVYYSSPHFLYGIDSLIDGVIGMNPVKEEHMVYFDIQMLTGIIMEVANRLQVNLFVEPYEWVDDTILIRPTYLPVLWLNESSSIDQESADFFIGSIQTPLLIARILIAVLLAIGGGLIIGVIVTCICWHYQEEPKPIDDDVALTRAEEIKTPEMIQQVTT